MFRGFVIHVTHFVDRVSDYCVSYFCMSCCRGVSYGALCLFLEKKCDVLFCSFLF